MNSFNNNGLDSFYNDSTNSLLKSLKFEINLTDEEKQSYLNENKECQELNQQSDIDEESESSGNEYYSESEESSDLNQVFSVNSECLIPENNFDFSLQQTSLIEEETYFSEWAKFSLDSDFWNADEFSDKLPLRYSELKLTNEETAGLLTQRIVATGLSHLAQVPGQGKYIFAKLELLSKALIDIDILENYKYLMYIDLSDNLIEKFSVFSKMLNLIYLRLQKNKIELLDIKDAMPSFLTYLDISHNRMKIIPNLDVLWSLKHLDLSNNKIKCITGLWSLRYLEFLNLSHNDIKVLDTRVFEMNFKYLDVSHNKLSSWSSSINELTISQNLKHLDLSHNHLSTLQPMKVIYWLEKLDLSFNNIVNVKELNWLRHLKKLDSISINANKVWEMTDTRGLLIYLIPSLAFINTVPINPLERLYAADLFNDTMVDRASQIYSWLLAKRHSSGPAIATVDQTMRVYDRDIVVMVGPPGSCKWEIIENVCKSFPNQVRMARLITTSNAYSKHMLQVTMDQFNNLINSGNAITYEFRLGTGYALSWEELKNDEHVILVGMELSSALCLIWQGLAPTLILTMTQDQDLHFERLKKLCQERVLSEGLEDMALLNSDNLFKLFTEGTESSVFKDSFGETEKKFKAELSKSSCSTLAVPSICFDSTFYQNPCWLMEETINLDHSVNTTKKLNIILPELKSADKIAGRQNTTLISNNNSFLDITKQNLHEIQGQNNSDELSICITEEEVEEEEYVDEEYVKNKLFIDTILKSRDEYFNIHNSMPGLFKNTVMTDDVNLSQRKIAQVVQEIYKKQFKVPGKYSYNIKDDPLYNETIIDYKNKVIKNLQLNPTLSHTTTQNDFPIDNGKNNFYFSK